MIALVLSLALWALPFKQTLYDVERLCMKDGYFIINWKGSPLTICEKGPTYDICYTMNPFDTVLRFNNSYVRVFDGDTWVYDLGRCYENIPLQR